MEEICQKYGIDLQTISKLSVEDKKQIELLVSKYSTNLILDDLKLKALEYQNYEHIMQSNFMFSKSRLSKGTLRNFDLLVEACASLNLTPTNGQPLINQIESKLSELRFNVKLQTLESEQHRHKLDELQQLISLKQKLLDRLQKVYQSQVINQARDLIPKTQNLLTINKKKVDQITALQTQIQEMEKQRVPRLELQQLRSQIEKLQSK